MSLGMGLLRGPTGGLFLMNEVPLKSTATTPSVLTFMEISRAIYNVFLVQIWKQGTGKTLVKLSSFKFEP